MKFGDRARGMLLIVAALLGMVSCSRDAEQSTDMNVGMDAGPPPVVTSDPVLRAAMLEEEDARGTGVSGIESLREGLTAQDADIQRVAVRGIGRLEDPELIPLTFPLLFSGDETVRAEAVNALGQAAFGSLGDEVADVLIEHLVRESQESSAVRAVIGRTLGRLRYADAVRFRRAQQTLLDLTRGVGGGWGRAARDAPGCCHGLRVDGSSNRSGQDVGGVCREAAGVGRPWAYDGYRGVRGRERRGSPSTRRSGARPPCGHDGPVHDR